jgi:hypothetical protein
LLLDVDQHALQHCVRVGVSMRALCSVYVLEASV